MSPNPYESPAHLLEPAETLIGLKSEWDSACDQGIHAVPFTVCILAVVAHFFLPQPNLCKLTIAPISRELLLGIAFQSGAAVVLHLLLRLLSCNANARERTRKLNFCLTLLSSSALLVLLGGGLLIAFRISLQGIQTEWPGLVLRELGFAVTAAGLLYGLWALVLIRTALKAVA